MKIFVTICFIAIANGISASADDDESAVSRHGQVSSVTATSHVYSQSDHVKIAPQAQAVEYHYPQPGNPVPIFPPQHPPKSAVERFIEYYIWMKIWDLIRPTILPTPLANGA